LNKTAAFLRLREKPAAQPAKPTSDRKNCYSDGT
jgi:hypothetical protein